MSSPRLRLGRVSEPGHVYVLTTVVEGRRRLFEDPVNAELVIDALRHVERCGRSRSMAWVVMPDHVHWLMELRRGTLATCMNVFKSYSSRKLGVGKVWQLGYYDHAVRTDESLEHAARYIIANPLRAGLAENMGEYPYAWCRWDL
jgi:REP element-mobilizing transposase RayT